VTGGTLTAGAEEVSINPRLATYLITVNDEAGNKIALFQGTVYRKKDSIADLVK
jgi:acyl-CoA thioesterase